MVFYYHGFNFTTNQLSPLQTVSEEGEFEDVAYRKLFDIDILSDENYLFALNNHESENYLKITVAKYNMPIF